MKHGLVTIKDIARELNISPSTVSRALKDHPDISPETKKAVNEVASKMDYQPNSIAMSLRKSKSFTLGVVIPEIVHHFFSTVISGIEDVAYDAGYNVMICQSNESYKRELSITNALLSHRVDGFLVSVSRETQDFNHFRNLIKKEIPIVFFDRASDIENSSKVVVDDFDGAYKATEHLIKTGSKRVLHLAGPENLSISKNRLNGYRKALADYGFPADDSLIVQSGLKREDGIEAMKKILSGSLKFDGIFAVSDPVAIGAMFKLNEKGIRIPEDVAIVGFSDEPLTSLIQPSLTTMAQPGFEMGQLAAKLFLLQEKDPDGYKPETKILKTKLVIRETSRK
jgi:DNA-binding LacI/PurR family transcriptional regulator